MTHYLCSECNTEGITIDDVKKNGCTCKIEPLMMLDPEDHETQEESNSNKKRSEAKQTYDLALRKIHQLVINENNGDEVYAVVDLGSHFEAFNLHYSRARHWLTRLYLEEISSTDLQSKEFFKKILESIISLAQMGKTRRAKIYTRIAHLSEEIWYNLHNVEGQVVHISLAGVKIEEIGPKSPIFANSQSLNPQILPEKGDGLAIEKLMALLKILKIDRCVFASHLVALFLEDIPVSIMVFDGSAGSVKTTTTAAIKAIVDPSGITKDDNVSAIPEKREDLIIHMGNRYLCAFDNVGHIDSKTSEIFCRVTTGSKNSRRSLYTNNEETIHSMKRKIVINGIVPTLEYTDLQTRIIKYSREKLDNTTRLTEKEFNRKFYDLLPFVLGQIFITLSKALRDYDKISKSIKLETRMTDFEVWCEIISRNLGYDDNEFLFSYYRKINEEGILSAESYPLVSVIEKFMEEKTIHEDSMTGLYSKLASTAEEMKIDFKLRSVRFPKASNKLRKGLIVIEPILAKLGFVLEYFNYTKSDGKFTKNASMVRISKSNPEDNVTGLPSPSSLSSPTSTTVEAKSRLTNFLEKAGEDGDDSEDVLPPPLKENSQKKYYSCFTCNKDGTEPLEVGKKSPNGLTVEDHLRLGHDVRFVSIN